MPCSENFNVPSQLCSKSKFRPIWTRLAKSTEVISGLLQDLNVIVTKLCPVVDQLTMSGGYHPPLCLRRVIDCECFIGYSILLHL